MNLNFFFQTDEYLKKKKKRMQKVNLKQEEKYLVLNTYISNF